MLLETKAVNPGVWGWPHEKMMWLRYNDTKMGKAVTDLESRSVTTHEISNIITIRDFI